MRLIIPYIVTALFVIAGENTLMGLQLDLGFIRINLLDIFLATQVLIIAVTPGGQKNSPHSFLSRLILIVGMLLFYFYPFFHFLAFGGKVDSVTNIFNLMRPFLYFMLMYFVVGYGLGSSRQIQWFVRFFVLLCFLVALENIYSFITGSVAGAHGRTVKGVRLALQSGTDSLFIMSALIIVSQWLRGKASFVGRTTVAPLFLGLFSTASRATIMGYLIGVLSSLMMLRRKSLRAFVAAVFLVAMLAASTNFVIGFAFGGKIGMVDLLRLDSITSKEGTVGERYYEYLGIWEKIKEKPLFGYGLRADYRYRNRAFDNFVYRDYSHNSYLQVVWNFGLIGFFFLSCVLFRLLIDMLILNRKLSDDESLRLSASLTGVYASYLIILFVAPNFHEFKPMLLLGTVTGLSLSLARLPRTSDDGPERNAIGTSG